MPEYQLITPPQELLEATTAYVEGSQQDRTRPTRLFLPTAVGVLLSPQDHILFSTRDVDLGNVYDLKPLGRKISEAETTGLINCGATSARLGDFRFLVHAGGVESLRILTARAIDLIVEQGGILPESAKVNVDFNLQYRGSGIEDSQGYKAGIEDLFLKRGLTYKVMSYPAEHLIQISI